MSFIKPMMCQTEKKPFIKEGYIFEQKIDGIRAILTLDTEIKIQGRKNPDITERYPELKTLQRNIKADRVVLDGEIAVFVDGISNFNMIQKREQNQKPFVIDVLSKKIPTTFVCFDILELNGKDLTNYPLSERKEILNSIITENERIMISSCYDDGVKLFALAVQNNTEGIISKRLDSKYLIGKRSAGWLKIKNFKETEISVDGYEPNNAGITVIRTEDNTRVLVAGQNSEKVKQRIDQTGQAKINIQYLEITDNNRFRMPTFRGNVYIPSHFKEISKRVK